MNPRYRIILYNRSDDKFGGTINIPQPLVRQVLAIAGIANNPTELGEYPLTDEQVRDISSLLSFGANPSRFHYHLETIDPGHNRLHA